MTDMPFAGITWLTMPYVVGLERLGFEAYYVEAHAIYPRHFHGTRGEGAEGAAAFIDRAMRYFGMPDGRFAFHALHGDESVWGMSDTQLRELYRSAALIINLHGGTEPRPEHYETGRLVLIDTDPVGFQVDVYNGDQEVIDYLEPHCAFFTWGTNFGQPDCGVPQSDRFIYEPTRMPILIDHWQSHGWPAGPAFTTIGNWSQGKTDEVVLDGELYTWSKHSEFEKFIDLPERSGRAFELALASIAPDDRQRLLARGWQVIDAHSVSTELDDYRRYIGGSRGEFTVAKDQNVRLRSGWFSDRSAAYLAAGRPVINQDTGFGSSLPTGEGVFAFSTTEDVLEALEAIDADYGRHCRRASEIAREYFDAEVVLTTMLAHLDLAPPQRTGTDGQTRIVIVNADDFGQSEGINRGIIEAHEHGVVTSTSLMVRGTAAAEAGEYAREHPALSVGLHLDFGEWGHVDGEWYPIYELPTTDEQTVRDEVASQLEAFRRIVGTDPTHLDSHQHAHRDEPVRTVALELAESLGVPLRDLSDRVRYHGGFYGQLDTTPYPEGISVEALVRLLADLPPGVHEIGCHPGVSGDFVSSYRAEREIELEVLRDYRVRRALAAAGCELRSFRSAFDGELASRSTSGTSSTFG
jgi:predicted glycoside hydrolase/deacetylase ChbG (UPF0249 family)